MKSIIFTLLGLLFFTISCKKDKNGPDLNKGLVAYLNFEDDVKDQKGYYSNQGSVGFAPGKVGKCASFNGIDNRLTYTPINPEVSDQVSLCFWVKGDVNAVYFLYADQGNYTPADYDFYMQPGSILKWSVKSANMTSGFVGAVLPLNEWQYVVVTYDATTLKMYVNQELKNSSEFIGFTSGINKKVTIGYSNAFGYEKNMIDELRIYNRALSPAEVTQLYNLK